MEITDITPIQTTAEEPPLADEPDQAAKFVGITEAPDATESQATPDAEPAQQDEQVVLPDAQDGQTGGAIIMIDSADQQLQTISGTEDNDFLSASVAGYTLLGLAGDDILVSRGGNTMIGGDGSDVLDSSGNDHLYGGDGADIFLLTIGSAPARIMDFGSDDVLAIIGCTGNLIQDGASITQDGTTIVEFATEAMAKAAAVFVGATPQ